MYRLVSKGGLKSVYGVGVGVMGEGVIEGFVNDLVRCK